MGGPACLALPNTRGCPRPPGGERAASAAAGLAGGVGSCGVPGQHVRAEPRLELARRGFRAPQALRPCRAQRSPLPLASGPLLFSHVFVKFQLSLLFAHPTLWFRLQNPLLTCSPLKVNS